MTIKEKRRYRLLINKIELWTYGATGVLGISDQIAKLPGVPPIIAHYWPALLVLSMIIKAAGHAIITNIELKEK
jgi:hypothetical protein